MDALVATRAGKLRGTVENDIFAFRAIPFAKPPEGPLRFRPPQPAEPWTDVRDATRAGAIAPQLPSPLEAVFGAAPPTMGEDSLLLNVWTPGLDDDRRPVMVWIHGGAFVNGSGTTPWYDGARFAGAGDVVVVTLNYRLGATGFLHLDELGGEAFAGSGNAGILDQVCALEWVRDNIESFGGNPHDVTVFGESAGGMSVGTLLGLPTAQGLFHKAIIQSGSASFGARPETATRVAEQVIAAAGLARGDVAGLVELPVAALLRAQAEVLSTARRLEMPFQPVIDGTVLPRLALDSVREGELGNVPTLIGTTLDEMTLFMLLDPKLGDVDRTRLEKRAAEMLGRDPGRALELYEAHRPDASPVDILVAMSSDQVFRIPAIRLGEAQATQDRAVFSYLFTWTTPAFGGSLKSCHALELPFVWDVLAQPGISMFTGDGPERQALATRMHGDWIRFARTGDPGWPAYDLTRRATQVYDAADNPIVDDPMGDERALWDGAIP